MENQNIVSNTAGQGLLRIVPFEIGDYLKSDIPNVVSWYDCRGSVGKYVSLLNETKIPQSTITANLRNALNSGQEFKLASILAELTDFSTIFPAGSLAFDVYDESLFNNANNTEQTKYGNWGIVQPKHIQKVDENRERDGFRDYFNEQLSTYDWVPGDIVGFTTSGFYDGFDNYLIFTQRVESLNSETIKEYEQLIQLGKRPYCIIYTSRLANNDNNYVIDGHHKIMAYHNLNIRPNILEITQVTESETPKLDLSQLENDLFDALYSWQLKHIFDKGIYRYDAFSTLLENPENRFNQFVKNGYTEEHWANGNLKSRGTYENNQPTGTVEHFYPNGNPKSIEVFKQGKQFRFIKAWYPSGALQLENNPIDDLHNGEELTYHKSGKISGRKIYKNGKIADGISVFAYNEEGKTTYEAEYLNGKNVKSKWFD